MRILLATITMCLVFVLGSFPAYATVYKLKIEMDPNGVAEVFSTGQKIAVTKKAPEGGNSVIWLGVQAGNDISISWQDNYDIYSSFTEIETNSLDTPESCAVNERTASDTDPPIMIGSVKSTKLEQVKCEIDFIQ